MENENTKKNLHFFFQNPKYTSSMASIYQIHIPVHHHVLVERFFFVRIFFTNHHLHHEDRFFSSPSWSCFVLVAFLYYSCQLDYQQKKKRQKQKQQKKTIIINNNIITEKKLFKITIYDFLLPSYYRDRRFSDRVQDSSWVFFLQYVED